MCSPQCDWQLVYSSDAHGCSLRTLYRRAAHAGPVLLIVVDTHGHVFGGYASEGIKVRPLCVGLCVCLCVSEEGLCPCASLSVCVVFV